MRFVRSSRPMGDSVHSSRSITRWTIESAASRKMWNTPATNSIYELLRTNHITNQREWSKNPEAQKRMYATFHNLEDQRAFWRHHPTNAFSFNTANLVPRKNYTNGYPFLVVSVDKKIMSGHDDISNTNLISFLEEYIFFCQNSGATQ